MGTDTVVLLPPTEFTLPSKPCVECGTMLNAENGYIKYMSAKTGRPYLISACRPCHNH